MTWASYHNHSQFSDGKASVRDLVAAAAAPGRAGGGISDHLTLHPSGVVPPWSMAAERLPTYVDEVLAAATESAVTVRLGLEVDWFDGHRERIVAALADHPFDYLIGSVHEVDGFPVDRDAATWLAVSEGERNRIHARYWQAVWGLARSGLFDVVGHLDLPKKSGLRPTADLSRERAKALDAIRDAGLVVELNTSGWHVPCDEAYPAPDLVAASRERGIPMTLSADAHRPENLIRDFPRGAAALRAAGAETVVRFCRRRRQSVPLPARVGAGPAVRDEVGGG